MLAASWTLLQESLLEDGFATAAKEAVATTVSVAKSLSNRMGNVFLTGSPFPGRVPESAGGWLGRVVVRDIAIEPGESAVLLPDDSIPPELAWSTPNPAAAAAFARASAVQCGTVRPSRALATDEVALLPAGHIALLTALASTRSTTIW